MFNINYTLVTKKTYLMYCTYIYTLINIYIDICTQDSLQTDMFQQMQ